MPWSGLAFLMRSAMSSTLTSWLGMKANSSGLQQVGQRTMAAVRPEAFAGILNLSPFYPSQAEQG